MVITSAPKARLEQFGRIALTRAKSPRLSFPARGYVFKRFLEKPFSRLRACRDVLTRAPQQIYNFARRSSWLKR